MKSSQQELRELLKGYVDTLGAVIEGKDEFFADYGIGDDDRDEYSDAYARLDKYFEDVLDVEYRVDAGGNYKGVTIALTLGGPNIYLDTCEGELRGYWGCDKATVDVFSEEIAPIDDYFAEQWSCVR